MDKEEISRRIFLINSCAGGGQPTCTIQALAFRAADNIIRMARSGEIK